LIETPERKRRRRLTVLNTLDDFNRLIEALAGYGRPARIAFEATDSYHRALAWHLCRRVQGEAGLICCAGANTGGAA